MLALAQVIQVTLAVMAILMDTLTAMVVVTVTAMRCQCAILYQKKIRGPMIPV